MMLIVLALVLHHQLVRLFGVVTTSQFIMSAAGERENFVQAA